MNNKKQPLDLDFKSSNDKQIEAASYWTNDEVEEIVYGGAKGGGKSYLGASLIFGDALMYPETHYFIARKELNDLRKFTIPTIYEVFQKWGLVLEDYAKYDGQLNCFKLTNGSKVFLIQCNELPSDPLFERFGSMQMTRGWIEEAGEVAESAKANLFLSIGRWKNNVYGLKKKLLITCNPKRGWLKRNYVDPFKQGILHPAKRYIQAFARDNDYLPDDYVQTLANETDPTRRARLYLGDWEYNEDQTALLTDAEIESIFTNSGIAGKKYMTIDSAFMGKDRAVIFIWNGYIIEHAYVFARIDHETFLSTVDFYLKLHSIERRNVVADATGEGAYVPTFLKGVRGFIGASSPITREDEKVPELTKPFFANLRAQCVWEFSQRVKEGKVAFKVNDPEMKEKLTQEMEQWKVVAVDNDRKILIIPKEEMKEALGRSPDLADAMYEREFFELDHDARRSVSAEIVKKQEQVVKRRPFNPMGI